MEGDTGLEQKTSTVWSQFYGVELEITMDSAKKIKKVKKTLDKK